MSSNSGFQNQPSSGLLTSGESKGLTWGQWGRHADHISEDLKRDHLTEGQVSGIMTDLSRLLPVDTMEELTSYQRHPECTKREGYTPSECGWLRALTNAESNPRTGTVASNMAAQQLMRALKEDHQGEWRPHQ